MDLSKEKQMIERAKVDPEVFGELFQQYYSQILNYVLRRVGDLQVAQDVTSDIFFIVLQKLWQFRWRNVPFSAWLYRIAGNEVRYYFRKNKRRHLSLEHLMESGWEAADECDLEAEFKAAEQVLAEHQEFLKLHKHLLTLPIKYQEVISLRYFENQKISQISLILGKNENTVKSLLKRGMELLRKKHAVHILTQPHLSSDHY